MISTCLLLKAICCIIASGFLFFSVLTSLFSPLQPSYTFLLHYLLHCVKFIQLKIFFLENLEFGMNI